MTRRGIVAEDALNPNHARRLSVTCRHIDKLLADMEEALRVSSSRQAFPQYIADVPPAHQRVIEQGISRMRKELIEVLDDHGVGSPAPSIPVSRFLHTILTFIKIAVEELRPRHMRGYGEISEKTEQELNDIVNKLLKVAYELDHYVAYELDPASAHE